MKRILLSVFVILAALSLSAQVTWTARDYSAENDIMVDSVAVPAGESVTVDDITFTAHGATNWFYRVSEGEFEYNGVTYGCDQIQGQSNGKAGYIDGGNISSVAVFQATKNGSLDLTFKFGYNKPFFVAEFTLDDLDVVDLSSVDQVLPFAYNEGEFWGGYWSSDDGTYYYPEAGPVDGAVSYFTGCTIDIVADNVYYAWASGSKIMLTGFTFTPEGEPQAVTNISSKATVVKTEYFNLLGVKLTSPSNGVNIIRKTLSDGSVITTKGVFAR